MMIRFMVTCCCLILAFAARAKVTDIDNAELAKLTASGVPVIDVRTSPEWEQTGIVPGSHLPTFFDARGKSDPAAWLQKAKAIARPGDPLIVICRSGNRSGVVSRFLSEQAGYTKVYNVKHGMIGWSREGRPTASAAPVLAACRQAKTC